MFPYIEQQNLYNYFASRGFDKDYGPKWWQGLTDEERKQFGSVSGYLCPSRRGGVQITKMNGNGLECPNDAPSFYGPQGDYAIVVCYQHTAAAEAETAAPPATITHWYRHNEPNNAINCHQGPFRVASLATAFPAIPSNGVYSGLLPCLKSWGPRDTFARLSDGTSNQLLIGEKHIATKYIGECKADIADKLRLAGDCSYLIGGDPASLTMGRTVRNSYSCLLNTDPNNKDWGVPLAIPSFADEIDPVLNFDQAVFRFGSIHPGTCLFLFGDGSVKGASLTTPGQILASLGVVDDETTVSLP